MKSPRLFFSLLLFITFFSSCAQPRNVVMATPETATTERNLSGLENDVLLYINKYRTSIGKSPLQMIDAASKQAFIHSEEMAKHSTPFGHEGFETRITNIRQSLGSVHSAAENVAYGVLTAEEVVNGWLKSPGHKKNIQGDYNLTGIGVARDKNGYIYFTQIFVNK